MCSRDDDPSMIGNKAEDERISKLIEDEYPGFTEKLEDLIVRADISPLYVHTVSIGNLSYSWEDYGPGINVKADLQEALSYEAVMFEIHEVFVNEPGVVKISFTTFTANRYKDSARPSYIRATITCQPKETE